jgi:hypothetical protein
MSTSKGKAAGSGAGSGGAGSGAGAAPTSSPPPPWPCPVCSYPNDAPLVACEMCGIPRPEECTPAPAPAAASASAPSPAPSPSPAPAPKDKAKKQQKQKQKGADKKGKGKAPTSDDDDALLEAAMAEARLAAAAAASTARAPAPAPTPAPPARARVPAPAPGPAPSPSPAPARGGPSPRMLPSLSAAVEGAIVIAGLHGLAMDTYRDALTAVPGRTAAQTAAAAEEAKRAYFTYVGNTVTGQGDQRKDTVRNLDSLVETVAALHKGGEGFGAMRLIHELLEGPYGSDEKMRLVLVHALEKDFLRSGSWYAIVEPVLRKALAQSRAADRSGASATAAATAASSAATGGIGAPQQPRPPYIADVTDSLEKALENDLMYDEARAVNWVLKEGTFLLVSPYDSVPGPVRQSPRTASLCFILATALFAQRRFGEAETLFREALERMRRSGCVQVRAGLVGLARVLAAGTGGMKFREADALLQEAKALEVPGLWAPWSARLLRLVTRVATGPIPLNMRIYRVEPSGEKEEEGAATSSSDDDAFLASMLRRDEGKLDDDPVRAERDFRRALSLHARGRAPAGVSDEGLLKGLVLALADAGPDRQVEAILALWALLEAQRVDYGPRDPITQESAWALVKWVGDLGWMEEAQALRRAYLV